MTDEKPIKPPSAEIVALVDRAAYYGQSTLADDTKKAYRTEYGHFRRWAEARQLPAMPPDVATVAVYLAALADGNVEMYWVDRAGRPQTSKKTHKFGSIQRAYISIVHEIRAAGHEWPHAIPAITSVMRGIKYRHGDKKKRMAPLEVTDLRACLAKMRERRFEDLTIIRDRALLSLGFFSAMRRSEIVGLNVDDLEFVPEGLIVRIRKSKGDQFQEGQEVGLHSQRDALVCPVALCRRYLDVSELKAGPLFRRIDSRSDCMGDKPLTRGVVATMVKHYAELAGLDPERFAGHSLRAGFATTAADRGRSLTQIMRQGRWKDQRTAQGYIRPATMFADNATAGLSDDPGTCQHS